MQLADPRRNRAPGLVDRQILCADNKILRDQTWRQAKNLWRDAAYRCRHEHDSSATPTSPPSSSPSSPSSPRSSCSGTRRSAGPTSRSSPRMYLVTALGITIGYHRLLTHRAFQTHKPVEYALAAAGSMAVQGPVIDWVADHRKHHAHTDEEGDPHSPHVGHGSGLAGLWHAHVGWLFDTNGQADRRKYAPDLMDDRGMRLLNRRFLSLVGALAGAPVRARLAAHRDARRRAHRAALGRARADLLRPPHHLVDQLDLPLPRQPPLRHRRPLDQRLVALARLARRGLAPQPPRLPALGRPRPAPLGARPVRARSSARCSGSAWPGTWSRITPERQAQTPRGGHEAEAQAA